MNEILAILFFCYYAEYDSIDNLNEEWGGELVELFDIDQIIPDLFAAFTWVLNLGVKELYGFSDDVTAIKNAIGKKKQGNDLFQFES